MPVMSPELYECFANINKIDLAIAEAEKEYTDGAAAIDAELAKEGLNKKYYGYIYS